MLLNKDLSNIIKEAFKIKKSHAIFEAENYLSV